MVDMVDKMAEKKHYHSHDLDVQLKYYTYVHDQNNKDDDCEEDNYNITIPESGVTVYPTNDDNNDVINGTINTTTTNESNNEDSVTTGNDNFPQLIEPVFLKIVIILMRIQMTMIIVPWSIKWMRKKYYHSHDLDAQRKYYTYVHDQNNKDDDSEEDHYNITLPEAKATAYPTDDDDVTDGTINTTTTNDSNNEDSATTGNEKFHSSLNQRL